MFKETRFQELVIQPDAKGLQSWMELGANFEGGKFITENDLRQRFALAPYIRMYQVEGIDAQELSYRFFDDAVTYVEENVLRVKLGQRMFRLSDGGLYSEGYGEKSFLEMCRDAVLARKEKGIDTERAEHEGLGISNLVKILEVMDPGEVVVVISPPDPTDETMGGYSMAYVYEKQEGNNIWFGAVRDEHRTIGDWQDLAKENSLWQADWASYDHLKFVALPFVAKNGLGQVLRDLGVTERIEIPSWVEKEARISANMISEYVAYGNYDTAQQILDSFKTAVIAGRRQTRQEDMGYSVASMVLDPRYLMMVQNEFFNNGGNQVINAGGVCGKDEIVGMRGGIMDPMTEFKNDNNLMSGVMGIGESESTTTSDGKPEGTLKELECVHCPLCGKDGVTAYITATHIHCSKCKKSKRLS